MNVHKGRKSITQRPFRILADCERIYQFLLEIYERDWRNGVPVPFFEYAYASFSYWMDISYSYKNRIWECNKEIVAFCFYENPVTDIYFCLKPGYEKLSCGGGIIWNVSENQSIRRNPYDRRIGRILQENWISFCCKMDILGKTIILAVSEISEDVTIGNTMMFCFHLGEGHENQIQKAYEVLKEDASNDTPVDPCDYSPCQFKLIDKFFRLESMMG